ncbi:flagellar hook-basal body protein [Candidatus Riflebacteria bacterium]
MIRGLYTSATGMLVENMRTDVLANNLANVNTTGYKRDIGIFRALPEKLIRRYRDQAVPPLPLAKTVKRVPSERELKNLPFRKPPIIGKMGTGATLDEVWVDQDEGSFNETGRNLDVAGRKNSFFVIENPKGGVLFSKNGSFNINENGFLVTQSGEYVLGFETGQKDKLPEIFLDDKGKTDISLSRIYAGRQDDFRIDADGLVFPGVAESNHTIMRVHLDNPRKLRKVGNNFYQHKWGDIQTDMDSSMLVGYLEKANFSVVSEMVELITASRAYESNSRVIQTHDSLLDRSVNTLGRVG